MLNHFSLPHGGQSLQLYLFASYLSVLNDGRGRGVDSKHGIVVVRVMLRIRLVGRHDGWWEIKRGDTASHL